MFVLRSLKNVINYRRKFQFVVSRPIQRSTMIIHMLYLFYYWSEYQLAWCIVGYCKMTPSCLVAWAGDSVADKLLFCVIESFCIRNFNLESNTQVKYRKTFSICYDTYIIKIYDYLSHVMCLLSYSFHIISESFWMNEWRYPDLVGRNGLPPSIELIRVAFMMAF